MKVKNLNWRNPSQIRIVFKKIFQVTRTLAFENENMNFLFAYLLLCLSLCSYRHERERAYGEKEKDSRERKRRIPEREGRERFDGGGEEKKEIDVLFREYTWMNNSSQRSNLYGMDTWSNPARLAFQNLALLYWLLRGAPLKSKSSITAGRDRDNGHSPPFLVASTWGNVARNDDCCDFIMVEFVLLVIIWFTRKL